MEVSLRKLKTVAMWHDEEPPKDLEPQTYVDVLSSCFGSARRATLAWVFFCMSYWALLVLIPCIYRNNLTSYRYVFWIFGMLGIVGVYYAVKAGHPADSSYGKPVVAFTVILMSVDWCTNAYLALQVASSNTETPDYILMFFHCIAILWATLFFYNRAVKSGEKMAWFTLFAEWLDLIAICIVIAVLHNEYGECRNNASCWTYFVVLVVKIFLWFTPIMFGFAETERNIHIHICCLDAFTDLPLVLIVFYDKGYQLHWVVFADIAFKILLIIRSVVYHGIINLAFRYEELKQSQRQYDQMREKLDKDEKNRAQDSENQIR